MENNFWRKRGRNLAVMLAFAVSLTMVLQQLFSAPALAVTFTVTQLDDPAPDGCDDNCSLREAILAANANPGPDVITLPAGAYQLEIAGRNEEGGETGDLDVHGHLTINGAGRNSTFIDGGGLDRVFHIHSGSVTINGVTIRNGVAEDDTGGGIKNAGDLTINNSAIVGNAARYGAGIHNSTYGVIDNKAPVGGPGYNFVDISSSTPLDLGASNSAVVDIGFAFDYYGYSHSFVYVSSEGYLQFVDDDTTQSNNQPIPSSDQLYNSILPFWDNLSQGDGNIYVDTLGTSPNRRFIVQYENVTVGGTSESVTFQVILEEATNQILFQYEDVSADSTTRGDSATIGIVGPEEKWDAAQYSFEQAVLTDNLAILFTPRAGRLVLNDVVVEENVIGGSTNPSNFEYDVEGGGLYNNGIAHILDSTFHNNRETALNSLNGAGIANRGGTVFVTDTVVSANVASQNGGGISNRYGWFSLVDSEVSDNVTDCYDHPTGGGISNRYGNMQIRNTHIVRNSLMETETTLCSGSGAGLDTFGGTVIIESSTIAENAILLPFDSPFCCPGSSGGGIQAIMSTVVITGSNILTNTTGISLSTGAGIDLIKSTLLISYSRIVSNTNPSPFNDFESQGGGIRADQSTLEIYQTEIVNNVAVGGGGGGIAHFAPPSYTVIDNKSPLGPVYNFEDISNGIGIPLDLDDDDAEQRAIGFPFRFYGDDYGVVTVSSNGYLIFNNGNPDDFDPFARSNNGDCYDNNGAPNLAIFAFTDDLDPSSGGEVYVRTLGSAPNRRFIVQYDDIPFFGDPDAGTVTFQVILYEGSNEIKFQYEDMEDSDRSRGAEAFVMVESANFAPGSAPDEFPNFPYEWVEITQYHECDTESTRLSNGLAVLFRPIGDLIINKSVITGNEAGGKGGGLYHYGYFEGGVAHLINTTISGNSAQTGTNIYDEYSTLSIRESGKIVLRKVTEPAGGIGFTIDNTFDGPVTLDGGDSITLTNVPTGTYFFTESVPAGWDLVGLTCDDPSGDSTVNPAAAAATLRITARDVISCTFTNRQRGQVVVQKTTTPGGGSGFDFSGDLGPFTLADGQMQATTVLSGVYEVVEATQPGWYLAAVNCADPSSDSSVNVAGGSASVAVAPGETVICTFTNEQFGSITVAKTTDPAGGAGFGFTSNFTDDFTLDDGGSVTVGGLRAGNYNVSESAAAGWVLARVTCSDGSDPAAIALAPGEHVTCTFTNEESAGTLVLVKDTEPDDATANWLFDVAGPIAFQQAISGDGRVTTTVTAGTYAIIESAGADTSLNQYDTSYVCDPGPSGDGATATNVEVNGDATVVCTFTNVRRLASIDVTKTVGNDPNLCAATTTLTTTTGTTTYFCITVENTGLVALHTHRIEDPLLGIDQTIEQTLAPHQRLVLTHEEIAALAVTVSGDLTNTVTVTSSSEGAEEQAPEAVPVTATAQASAEIVTPRLHLPIIHR